MTALLPTRGTDVTEDELSSIAQQLVGRLREDDPEAVNRWLCSVLPSSVEWFRLCFVLAAAVPDDESWKNLTAWTLMARNNRGKRSPCGTNSAAKQHRNRGEVVCEPCLVAERAYRNELYARKQKKVA
jgi:proline racemase